MFNRIFSTVVLLMALTIQSLYGLSENATQVEISKLELGFPVPAIPFYHFVAELELSEPSIIEVEVSVGW